MSDLWLKCSACRKDIGFQAIHWVCSVSTCNRSRTRLVFCSVPCWDSHVATLRHRDSWAVEARSPSRAQWQAEQAQAEPAPAVAPRPVTAAPPVVRSAAPAAPAAPPSAPVASPAPVASSSAASAGPAASAASSALAAEAARRRIIATPEPAASSASTSSLTLTEDVEREVLVVVSKMKKYIRDRSGMNCSDAVADALSEHLRALCDQAIRTASADGRKTVLDRDVARVRPPG